MVIKTLFDVDGMVIKNREAYFSKRLSQDYGVNLDKILPFFENEFQLCLIGRADLKEELEKYLKEWKWNKPVDDLLKYWFENERTVDLEIIESVKKLRSKGTKCYVHTNNEKYRTEYLWSTIGLRKYFDGVFSSTHVGYKKPEVQFWQSVCDLLGCLKTEEILVWDDDPKNIQSAKNFGFQAELYTDPSFYKRRMIELNLL